MRTSFAPTLPPTTLHTHALAKHIHTDASLRFVPYDAATATGFAHYWRLLPERGTRGALPCDVLMGGGFLTHRIKASIKGTKVCVLVCFLLVCVCKSAV